MNDPELVKRLRELSEKEFKKWERMSLNLFIQFENSLFLDDPYRIVLDSNILMRFDNQSDIESADKLAIRCFFDFFKNQTFFKASLLVRPPVFYEMNWRKQLNSEIDYWERIYHIKDLISDEFGLKVMFENLSTYVETSLRIDQIKNDEIKIKGELQRIENDSWDFQFIRDEIGFDSFPTKDGRLEVIPISAARQLAPNLNLNYFSSQIAQFCFADHILRKMIQNKMNNQDVINKYYNKDQHVLHKILKLRGNQVLEGLADLDFLAICNVNRQFQIQANSNYLPSSIPLSIDKNLSIGLELFSSTLVINSSFAAGEPEQLLKFKWRQNMEQNERARQSEPRKNEFRKLAGDYWKNFYEQFEEKIANK